MAKDYYKILGVDKNATQDDIKKRIERLLKNITQTYTQAMQPLLKSLRK